MVKCQATERSGRQEAECGHPPGYARSQKREPAFWVLLKDKKAAEMLLFYLVMPVQDRKCLGSQRITY